MSYIPIEPGDGGTAGSGTGGAVSPDLGETDTVTLLLREQQETRQLLEEILTVLTDIKERLESQVTNAS